MSISIEINGVPYSGFLTVNISRSMETLSGTFDVTYTITSPNQFPIKLGAKVQIFIAEESVINGFVETIETSYTNDSHEIFIAGRDNTMDIIDSSVDGNLSFSDTITLKSLIERIISQNNINIPVIDNVNPRSFNPGEFVDSEIDQNMFDLINTYCKKRQVFITASGDGELVIERASEQTLPVKLTHIEGSTQNNILSASSRYDISERFNKYVVKSQPSLLQIQIAKLNPESAVNQGGVAFDNQEFAENSIRKERVLVLVDDSNTTQTSKDRATWESNIRRSRGSTYTCSVQGFTVTPTSDQIWRPNRLVQVFDEKSNVDSALLIKSVAYAFDRDEGSITTLQMGTRDSFTLQAEQDSVEKKVNKFGFDF